ncbi:MAG: hypothetical protein IJ752_03920 [Alphaproteobacteria bacterium]|nr:hypothetical protein [Alphaproteobacteria bacterium]
MLIELAHYTVLFALTVVGLQTFLLCPTLWSGGSAVAIKMAFRGACFTTGLLFLAFSILLFSFAVHDFSLAVVFEKFDSQSEPFYILQAFCSSREGFFFTFIVTVSFFFLAGFSKKELATYQERGRYLFSGGGLIFALLILMLSTADPFIRIAEPPFEGLGFSPEWRPPYRIIFVLLSFGACANLTVSFIKTLCIYSKGRQFVVPTLRDTLLSLILQLCALGIELMTGFTTSDNAALWQWTPGHSLLLSVILLMCGQILLLFFCLKSTIFVNWTVFLSFLGTLFSNANFLAAEYRLFSLAPSEVYFPNPITALCAFAGFVCFLLFLCSVTLKKTFKESSFSFLSRESFVGLAAVALLAAGFSIGSLSLLPAFFMFLPDLPLRLLPALFKTTLFWTTMITAVFLFIAFKRQSVAKGWARINKKNTLIFWSSCAAVVCFGLYHLSNGRQIALYSLPAILILGSMVSPAPIKIPTSVSGCLRLLKSFPSFKYGTFFCAVGFLLFSTSLSCAIFNQTETTAMIRLQETAETAFPCSAEQLSAKTDTSSARYRLLCPAPIQQLSGETVFQWREKELKAKFLQTNRFSTRLFQIDQIQEDVLNLHLNDYPALQLAGSGMSLICLGLVFLMLSVKKGNCA